MKTTITVDGYTYHLVKYAYVTVGNRDYIGSSSSPDLKFAGEVLEVPEDHEWLTPLTPIERAPLGDTFVMEGGKDEYSRHYLEEQLKEEQWLESRRVKPGWQTFALRQPT